MAGHSGETGILLGSESPKSRQRILADLFTRHRDRLRSMVQLRLDRRLRARVDPSDVLQEAFLEASRRLEEYVLDPPMPVFIWLRWLTARKLVDLHRHHMKVRKRSPAREVSLDRGQREYYRSDLVPAGLEPAEIAVAEVDGRIAFLEQAE